jgi:hypothetical protein
MLGAAVLGFRARTAGKGDLSRCFLHRGRLSSSSRVCGRARVRRVFLGAHGLFSFLSALLVVCILSLLLLLLLMHPAYPGNVLLCCVARVCMGGGCWCVVPWAWPCHGVCVG